MLSLSKNNLYRIAVEKWTIDIASLWKLTIAEVYSPNIICNTREFANIIMSKFENSETAVIFLPFDKTHKSGTIATAVCKKWLQDVEQKKWNVER